MNENRLNSGQIAVAQSMENSAVEFPKPEPADAYRAINRPIIGAEELKEAELTLMKYKQGKINLERNVVENQQWYKLRQWEILRRKQNNDANKQVEPVSGWLFNSIANKHAVAMDNFPRPNIIPREKGDREQAEILSAIIPVILDQCEFEETYSTVIDDLLINGTAIYGVFWDSNKHNGLGDVDIKPVDMLNLFWEPGIQNIDVSKNIFYVSLEDNDVLEKTYPQFKNKLGGRLLNISEYVYDDTVDTAEKSIVIDWYYKKNGKLHYCKWISGQMKPLFATENDSMFAERGWYDDGEYPFVAVPLFRCKGTPCGFSYIDVGKSAQEYIDRSERAIQQNLQFNAKPRHFIRTDGAVNEKEYADSEKDLVHVDGSLGQDSVMPIQVNPLSGIYVQINENKINELKETTGNRDVNTGGTSGAIAASAIAAQQEAGAKLDRDCNKTSYRAYRKVIIKVIERIRQFYDQPRFFRIIGQNGYEQFVQFDNSGIVPQHQGIEFGVDMGFRVPYFDIEVTAEKSSPYSRASQNELAFKFYSAGFFAPENSTAALACLTMMDFDHKQDVIQQVSQNGTMFQMLMQAQQQALQMAMIVDADRGSNFAAALQQQYSATMGGMIPGSPVPGQEAAKNQKALGGNSSRERKITENARKRTAEAGSPN